MAQTVRGVVARAKGAPVTIEQIVVPDPGPGEAVVRVQACGVCHTDLHYREGAINDEFPFLLGHEAAGVVEAVGDDVTNLSPGDFVRTLDRRNLCAPASAVRQPDRHTPVRLSTTGETRRMSLSVPKGSRVWVRVAPGPSRIGRNGVR